MCISYSVVTEKTSVTLLLPHAAFRAFAWHGSSSSMRYLPVLSPLGYLPLSFSKTFQFLKKTKNIPVSKDQNSSLE